MKDILYSFECFYHFHDHLLLKADWIIPSHRPPEEWPHQGKIEIENFELRYRENLPRTLKNLSCFIEKEEKVSVA